MQYEFTKTHGSSPGFPEKDNFSTTERIETKKRSERNASKDHLETKGGELIYLNRVGPPLAPYELLDRQSEESSTQSGGQ
jgi:hypothetical protein